MKPEMTAKRSAASAPPDLDLQTWIDALRALPAAAVTEADVLAWTEGPLRNFFPFEKFLGAYGNLSGGRIQMRSLVSSGHAPDFLAGLESKFDLKLRGCFAWWVSNRKAFILDKDGALDEAGVPITATPIELEEIDRFALGVVAAHGVIDPICQCRDLSQLFRRAAHLAEANPGGARPDRAGAAHAVPAHQAGRKSTIDLTALTDRQREMVDLAVTGLSDKEIARRLAISDHTVGNHFRAIYERLGVSKRSQLIALLK